MKKLSLIVLLLSLLCCVVLFTACDTSTDCPDGHTSAKLEAVAPTCTEDGLTEGEYCSVCNTVLTAQQKVPATGHDKSNWMTQVAATCTEDGARYKECKTCHAVLEVGTLTAGGHSFGSWKTTANATCTSEGAKERVCDVCDQKEVQVLPVTHRNSAWTIGAAATCTVDGFRYKTCRDCKAVTVTETLSATGHTCSSYTLLSSPTCATTGSQSGHCSVCDEDFEEQIAALGHDYPDTWTVVTPVSCSSAGLNTRTCRRSGCGIVETQTLTRLEHQKEWIVDFPATCETDGSKHEECSLCHEVFAIQKLSAVPHSANEWTTLVEATCQQAGLKVRICPYCNLNEKQTVQKTAHAESDWIVDIPATCHAQGSRHKSCQTCNTVLSTEVLQKFDHTPANTWIVATAPTATAAGTSKQICIACGDTLKSCANSLNLDATVVNSIVSGITLSNYTVVYADSCRQNSKLYSYITTVFQPALNAAAGKSITPVTDKTASTAASAKQILIGITSHEESTQAFSTLQGRGFTVRVDGNKIVILGTDDLLTMSALQYFVNNYLMGAGKTIAIPEDATAAGLSVVPLASAYGSPFAYVFDADWDIDPYHMYVGDSWNNQGYPGDGREYPTYVYEYLLARISQLSGLPVDSITSVNDTVTTYKNGYELLFATVDRAESRAFRNELDANQYGFRITGNKVILAAHMDAALEPLVEKFLDFYAFATEYNGGVLPQGYEEVYTLSGSFTGTILGSYTVPAWKLDFIRPENTELEMAENNNDDSIQMIYTGTGASVSGYLAYCQKLVDAGYQLVQGNDNPGNTGNYFRLYKHPSKQHVLYVAFDAFTYQNVYADRYKSESVQFGDFIHSSQVNSGQPLTNYPMRTYKQCIRIVSAPLAKAYLPDTKLLTQQGYTKICNSSITTIRYVSGSVGMGYVLQLEDGRFVIIDGGNYITANADREVLYNTLVELYKDAHDDAEPTTSKPIHIAAWLVTHSHGDHYANMNAFLKKYAAEKIIKMEYLIGNFPEISTIYPVSGDTAWMGNGNIANMQKYFTSAGLVPFKYVKMHTGMTLYFANLKIETLMTTEDHAPFRITNSNDTNTVTKWTIASTDAASGTIAAKTVTDDKTKTTWMVLGDSCIYASRWLCAMWGGNTYNTSTNTYDNSYMKSDMVQLAHHGNIGCEIAIYKTIQSKIVWFAHNAGAFNSYTQDSDKSWTDTVDRYAVNSGGKGLQTVQYIVVAGIAGNSYTDSVTISFNQNGISFPASNPGWGIKYNKTTGAVTTVTLGYNSGNAKVYTSPIIKK